MIINAIGQHTKVYNMYDISYIVTKYYSNNIYVTSAGYYTSSIKDSKSHAWASVSNLNVQT